MGKEKEDFDEELDLDVDADIDDDDDLDLDDNGPGGGMLQSTSKRVRMIFHCLNFNFFRLQPAVAR